MKIPNKEAMLDVMGRPLTQSLFLEVGYSEVAVYTLKEDHFEYKGNKYPSLKRLYIEMEDPTEYQFAITYLLGWKHWQRLLENKLLRTHIDEWREELEVKLRSRGVKSLMESAEAGNYQASKWLTDRGWDNKGAGRPSKLERDSHLKEQTRIINEFQQDALRLVGK